MQIRKGEECISMLTASINSQIRNEIGKNASHRVRDEGDIPAIVYGNQVTPIPIQVNRKQMEGIVRKLGTNAIINLVVGADQKTVMVKEIQRNPVSREMQHIDFQVIQHNEPVQTTVPVKLVGRGKEEYRDNIIQQQLRELTIECLPQHIPENIKIDISEMTVGKPLTVADVEFGEEISILNDPNETIATFLKADKLKEADEQKEEEEQEQNSEAGSEEKTRK